MRVHHSKTVTVAQSLVTVIEQKTEFEEDNRLSTYEYKEYLQFKAAQHASSAIVAHTGNFTVCHSHSAGSWILDFVAPVSDLSSITIPKRVQEALSHPGWRLAMIVEMTALESNHTWILVQLPTGKSIVGCRWVFTVIR